MCSKDLSKFFKGLSLKNKTDINLLLLGDRSVGKSQFINALSNCLIFDKLKDVKQETIRVLLPSRVSIKDKSSSCHLVKVGTTDDLDVNDVDDFSTRRIKTYILPLSTNETSKLHIIDTPGFSGPHYLDQDKRLCNDILTYIADLQELHAICWFLSPTELKISSFFDYCVNIILPRIDKRSYESLVFCFTKTRDFTSGETWLTLQKSIETFNSGNEMKIKWSNTQDDNNNIFCFENDFFRYLAGVKLGYSVEASTYHSSWEHTVKEMRRLVDHVLTRPKTVPLKNSSCINEGTRLITNISQPLFDILQLIQEQISLLEGHKNDLMTGGESLSDLKKNLYMPILTAESVSTGHPFLVCSSNKCLQFSMDWGKCRWELPKEKCHDKCYLSELPVHMVGGPQLNECEQIDKSSQLCRKCNCHYSLHLHLYYSLKWNLRKNQYIVKDESSPTEILSVMETLKEDMNKLINVYNDQKREIVTNLAQFAHFMENTSIIPYQNDYDEYIETLINRSENTLVMGNSEDKIQLQNLQSMFREKKKDYDTALTLQRKLNKDFNLLTSITPQKIMGNVTKLYNLGDTGKKIRLLIKAQKTARQNEHEQSVLNLVKTSVAVQKPQETKKDNKKKKVDKEESSTSDSDDSNSSEQKSKTVNTTNSNEKPGKVDVAKKVDNTKKNKKKDSKEASKEKKVKPVGGGTTATTKVVPNKTPANTKSSKKDKNVRVPPPSYESVIRSQPNNMNPNLPHTAGFSANVPSQGHSSGSQTIEVKVFNNPRSSSSGDQAIHGPSSPGFPHSQYQNFHPNNPYYSPSHGSFPHGPMPQGSFLHGPLPHGSLPHEPLPHGPLPNGCLPPGPAPQWPPFMNPLSPASSCPGSHFNGPQPHSSGHSGLHNLPPMHGANQDSTHFQGVPLHHGHPGPIHTGHIKHSHFDAKSKPVDKKEQVKFKRNLKKKLQNNKPKKEQAVKKGKSDSSSSSSSSDSD